MTNSRNRTIEDHSRFAESHDLLDLPTVNMIHSKRHSICHIVGVMRSLALVKRADRSHILIVQRKIKNADVVTLNALVTEDKTFTHMSGKTQTKEEFFGEIADDTLNYYTYKLNDPVVTVDGDTATLTGSTTLEAKVYGSSGTWTLPTNQKFVKLDGAWKLSN